MIDERNVDRKQLMLFLYIFYHSVAKLCKCTQNTQQVHFSLTLSHNEGYIKLTLAKLK